jgi:CubicO group peptidase (beta-lactamase class C family)
MKDIDVLNDMLIKHFKISTNSKLTIGIIENQNKHLYLFDKEGKKEYQDIAYGLGSISKTLIANILAKMIEKEEISLQDPLNKYFKMKHKKNIPTLLNLATHTSGYKKHTPFIGVIFSVAFFGFCRRNIYTNKTSKWLDRYIYKRKVRRLNKYNYSDFNYAVLGKVIEIVKKDSLENIIINFLKLEIKMKHTHFVNQIDKPKDSWIWQSDNPYRAAGGIISTADDMLKFLAYQMNPMHSYLSVIYQKYFQEKKKIYTSFSWNSFLEGKYYWHHGGMGYYRASVLFDDKRKIAVAVFANIKGKRIQRMGRLTSQIYRVLKRNKNSLFDYLDHYDELVNQSLENILDQV